jgi:polysaccharide transporter, PST family
MATPNQSKGGMFVAMQQVFNLLIHLTQIVLLSRILSPSDYGIAAMAGTIFTMANVFKDFGFSASAIQAKELRKQDSDNLFWIGMLVAAAIAATIVMLSPVVGWFYNQPIVTWLVMLMGVTYLAAALGNQPTALAQREFRFKPLAISGMAAKGIGFASGYYLALGGFGPWSIAWMHLIESILASVSGFVISGYWPGRAANLRDTTSHFKFGALMTVSGLMSFLSRNIDKILIGRLYGAEALGIYTRAHGMIIFPFTGLLAGFTRFNLASLSRLVDKNQQYQSYVLFILQAYLFVAACIVVPSVVLADEVVDILMGGQWAKVAPIFVIMAPYTWYQIISYLCNVSLISKGKMAQLTSLHFWNCILSTITIAVAAPFGLVGLAIGFSLAGMTIQLALFLVTVSREKSIEIWPFLKVAIQNMAAAVGTSVVALFGLVPFLDGLDAWLRIALVTLTTTLMLSSSLVCFETGRRLLASGLKFAPSIFRRLDLRKAAKKA